MNSSSRIAGVLFALLLVSGCGKPDSVATFKSPMNELFYTVETYYGQGPVSDTTRIFAHLDRDGKTAKMLVLEGGNITVNRLIWTSPTDVTLCLEGGATETFRNEVTMFAGGSSATIYNHLQEHCGNTAMTSPP